MKIDQKEVERIEHVWRNDFAQLYEDRPRLYNLLKSCTLDIGVIEIEPGIDMNEIKVYEYFPCNRPGLCRVVSDNGCHCISQC